MADYVTEIQVRDLIHNRTEEINVSLGEIRSESRDRLNSKLNKWIFIPTVTLLLVLISTVFGISVWLYGENENSIAIQQQKLDIYKESLSIDVRDISIKIIKIATNIEYMKEKIDRLETD